MQRIEITPFSCMSGESQEGQKTKRCRTLFDTAFDFQLRRASDDGPLKEERDQQTPQIISLRPLSGRMTTFLLAGLGLSQISLPSAGLRPLRFGLAGTSLR